MKFVIAHKNTKRTIDGAFNICGSEKDFQHLIDVLRAKLGMYPENDYSDSFNYGWIEVPEYTQKHLVDKKSIGWDEGDYDVEITIKRGET